jgi:uncharacterized membrane protein
MSDQMAVLLASYPDQALAETDWSVLSDMVREGVLDLDDAAVVVKDSQGNVGVVKDLHKPVKKGVLIGAALAAITPVGLVAGLAAGALGGKLTGLFHSGLSQATLKDFGDFMEEHSVMLVIAGPPLDVEGIKTTLKDATGFMQQTLDADGHTIRTAVDEAE